MTHQHFNRRKFMGLSSAIMASATFGGFIPSPGQAAGSRDPRFITILLRGGLDGLSAACPWFDPDYTSLRGHMTDRKSSLSLDDQFALHPSLVQLHRQYKAGQAILIHACASPYRNRSHFDGQDVLESGLAGVGPASTGWLNRMLLNLPRAQRVSPKGLAIGTVTPLILRGQADVLGWAPTTLGIPDTDFASRLSKIYERSDPALSGLLNATLRTGEIAAANMTTQQNHSDLNATMANGAARLLAADDGPRIAAITLEGWDTHAGEVGRLNGLLTSLDNTLYALEQGLGPVWRDTAILIVTEFGRTVAFNGTQGTDHGTATVAFLTGGAIKGGRVISDWPGLKPNQLYQGRDLAPTTDTRAVAKGVMSELYDIMPTVLSHTIFPGSASVMGLSGLIA